MSLKLSLLCAMVFPAALSLVPPASGQTSATQPFTISPTTAPSRYPDYAQPGYQQTTIITYAPAAPMPTQFSRNAFEFTIGGEGFTAHGSNGNESIGFVTFDAAWYFVPTLSLDLQAGIAPGTFKTHRHHHNDSDEDDGVRAVEEMALLRWHFLTLDRLSLYADGGIGGLHADPAFPSSGRKDNFLAAAGGGLSVEFAPHWYGLIGARAAWLDGGDWDHNNHGHHHWSDGVEYYGGFSFIFP